MQRRTRNYGRRPASMPSTPSTGQPPAKPHGRRPRTPCRLNAWRGSSGGCCRGRWPGRGRGGSKAAMRVCRTAPGRNLNEPPETREGRPGCAGPPLDRKESEKAYSVLLRLRATCPRTGRPGPIGTPRLSCCPARRRRPSLPRYRRRRWCRRCHPGNVEASFSPTLDPHVARPVAPGRSDHGEDRVAMSSIEARRGDNQQRPALWRSVKGKGTTTKSSRSKVTPRFLVLGRIPFPHDPGQSLKVVVLALRNLVQH